MCVNIIMDFLNHSMITNGTTQMSKMATIVFKTLASEKMRNALKKNQNRCPGRAITV